MIRAKSVSPCGSYFAAKHSSLSANKSLAFRRIGAHGNASPHRPTATIGDENANCAPASPYGMEQRMTQRRRFKQIEPLELRLAEEARRLRAEAESLPPGIERDATNRKARQAETGSHMSAWLRSPGLQPPE
jgi:hypothetical protein